MTYPKIILVSLFFQNLLHCISLEQKKSVLDLSADPVQKCFRLLRGMRKRGAQQFSIFLMERSARTNL